MLKRPFTDYFLVRQIYKEVFCKWNPLELLSKILERYIKKKFVFNKVADSKNELIHTNFLKFLLKVEVILLMTFGRAVYVN